MNPEVVMMHYERDYSVQLVSGTVAAASPVTMAPQSTKHSSNLSVITRRAFSQTNNTASAAASANNATGKRRGREADCGETKAVTDAEDKITIGDEERKRLKLRRRQVVSTTISSAPPPPTTGCDWRTSQGGSTANGQQLKERSIPTTDTDSSAHNDYIYKHFSYAPPAPNRATTQTEPVKEQLQRQRQQLHNDCDNDSIGLSPSHRQALADQADADCTPVSGTNSSSRQFITSHAPEAGDLVHTHELAEIIFEGSSLERSEHNNQQLNGDNVNCAHGVSTSTHHRATTSGRSGQDSVPNDGLIRTYYNRDRDQAPNSSPIRRSQLGGDSAMMHEHATTTRSWCTASLNCSNNDDDNDDASDCDYNYNYIHKCRGLNSLSSQSTRMPALNNEGDGDEDDDDDKCDGNTASSCRVAVIRNQTDQTAATGFLHSDSINTPIPTPTPSGDGGGGLFSSDEQRQRHGQVNGYFFGDGAAVDRLSSFVELSFSEQQNDSGCFCQDNSCSGLSTKAQAQDGLPPRARRESSLMCEAFERSISSASCGGGGGGNSHRNTFVVSSNTDGGNHGNSPEANSSLGQVSSRGSLDGSSTSSPLSADRGEERDSNLRARAARPLIHYGQDSRSTSTLQERSCSYAGKPSARESQHHNYLAASEDLMSSSQSRDSCDQGEASQHGFNYNTNNNNLQHQQQQTKYVQSVSSPTMSNQYFPPENHKNGIESSSSSNGSRHQRRNNYDLTSRPVARSDSTSSGDCSTNHSYRNESGHEYQQQRPKEFVTEDYQQERMNSSGDNYQINSVANQPESRTQLAEKKLPAMTPEVGAIGGAISTTNTTSSTMRTTLIPTLTHNQSYGTGAYSYNNIMQYSCEIIQTESMPSTTTKLVSRTETGRQLVEYRPIRCEPDYCTKKYYQHHQQEAQQQQILLQQQQQQQQYVNHQGQYQKANIGYFASMVPYYSQYQADSQSYSLATPSDSQNSDQQQQQYHQLKASLDDEDADQEATLYAANATTIAYQDVYGQDYCSIVEPIGADEFGDKTYHLLEPQLATYTLAPQSLDDHRQAAAGDNNQNQQHEQQSNSNARYYIDYHDYCTLPEAESSQSSNQQQQQHHVMSSYDQTSQQEYQQYYPQQSDVQMLDSYQQPHQHHQQHQQHQQQQRQESMQSTTAGGDAQYDPNADLLKSCMQQLELPVDFMGPVEEHKDGHNGSSNTGVSNVIKTSAVDSRSRSRRRAKTVTAPDGACDAKSAGQCVLDESQDGRSNSRSRATSRTGKTQPARRNNRSRAKLNCCNPPASELGAELSTQTSARQATEATADDDQTGDNIDTDQPRKQQRLECPSKRSALKVPPKIIGCKLETRERLREFLERRQGLRQAKKSPLVSPSSSRSTSPPPQVSSSDHNLYAGASRSIEDEEGQQHHDQQQSECDKPRGQVEVEICELSSADSNDEQLADPTSNCNSTDCFQFQLSSSVQAQTQARVNSMCSQVFNNTGDTNEASLKGAGKSAPAERSPHFNTSDVSNMSSEAAQTSLKQLNDAQSRCAKQETKGSNGAELANSDKQSETLREPQRRECKNYEGIRFTRLRGRSVDACQLSVSTNRPAIRCGSTSSSSGSNSSPSSTSTSSSSLDDSIDIANRRATRMLNRKQDANIDCQSTSDVGVQTRASKRRRQQLH